MDEPPLPAGDVSSWLTGMRAALRGERDADVPCDGCTACCRAGQFVHIEPDEQATLARIPSELLFPAPGLPQGHVLLGYDEHGHCPMLVEDRCSIYEDRPRTCRTYDCRVFAAADVDPADAETKVDVARRAARWRFAIPTATDRARLAAVRAAARHLEQRGSELPRGTAPRSPAELAVLAIELHELFLAGDEPATLAVERELLDRSARAGRR